MVVNALVHQVTLFAATAMAVWTTLCAQAQSSAQPQRGARAEGEPSPSRFASRRDLPVYIDALKKANDYNATKTLLKIALDKDVSEYHASAAAYAFRSTVTNKMEVAELLHSPKESVREIGFIAMKGRSIDRNTWENKFLPLLENGAVSDREWIILLAQADGGAVLPKEKAAALIKGMEGLESAPGSKQLAGYDDWLGPNYELVYRYLADALDQMEGLTLEDLRELTPTDKGPVRDCVLIARFSKGDVSARPEVAAMALGHPQYLLKARAVRAFVGHGTEQDIPLLEEIARTDSLSKTNKYPPAGLYVKDWQPTIVYPLREEARYGITNILRKAERK